MGEGKEGREGKWEGGGGMGKECIEAIGKKISSVLLQYHLNIATLLLEVVKHDSMLYHGYWLTRKYKKAAHN